MSRKSTSSRKAVEEALMHGLSAHGLGLYLGQVQGKVIGGSTTLSDALKRTDQEALSG